MSWHRNAARDLSIGPVDLMGREIARANGYSLLELERVGIDRAAARRLGIRVDPARTTSIGCNVMQLRAILEQDI
jgi:ribosomal protein L13E